MMGRRTRTINMGRERFDRKQKRSKGRKEERKEQEKNTERMNE